MKRYKALKKWWKAENCYYCKDEFGPLQDQYIVQEAVKPPKTPHRWRQIGAMCETCDSQGKPSHFDKFNDFKYAPPVDAYNCAAPKAG